MSITFACGHCGKSFTVDDKFAGKKGRCKQCGEVMPIPELTESRDEPDTFPFADEPKTAHGSLPPGIEEIIPGSPLAVWLANGKESLRRDPQPVGRNRKSGRSKGPMRLAAGAALGLVAVSLTVVVLIGRVDTNNRTALQKIISERVVLNQELAALLAEVNDVDSARSTSDLASVKVRAITANLKQLKATKGQKKDILTLKQQYDGPQLEAEQRVLGHIHRIKANAEVWEALAIQDALDEIRIEEGSLPGHANSRRPAPVVIPPRIAGRPGTASSNSGSVAGPDRAHANLDRVKSMIRKPKGRAKAGGPN